MKNPRARIRRLWVRLAQSRMLVPSLLALVMLFLATASWFIYQDMQVVRRYVLDQALHGLQHETTLASRQMEDALSLVQAEVTSLQRQGRNLRRAELERTMREGVERLLPYGVIQIGRIDARAQPHLVYEVGLPEVPPVAEVHSLRDLNRIHSESGSRGFDRSFLVISKPGDESGVQFYARVRLKRLLQTVLTGERGEPGRLYAVAPDGRLLMLRADTVAAPSPLLGTLDRVGRLSGIHPDLEERRSYQRWGAQPVTVSFEDEHHTLLTAVDALPGERLFGRSLGALVAVQPAETELTGLQQVQVRQARTLAIFFGVLLLVGVLIAAYQQRLSSRLKHLVGEQDQILASVLTHSVDGVIVFDDDDKIQMWNRGAQFIFGYTAEEMLGQGIERLIPPDMDPADEIQRINDHIREKGYLRNYVTHRLTRDGARITVDLSRTPYYSRDGKLQGSTAVIKDVTEQLEFDRKMYNAEKLASIGLLASGVAHEINNPISIILGFTDLLKERFAPGSPEYDDLEKIENNAHQARKIVEDLLDFSRAEEGIEVRADLQDTVRKLVEFVDHTRIAKKVELTMHVPDDIPAVNGDPREIQQVLLNLVNNATAAIEHREGVVLIQAEQVDDQWVELTVADNGKGIPEEDRARVFDPFFTTKEFGEGTGLGLSLCYGLVKKWGGSIELESQTADEEPAGVSGTRFRIRIPIYDANFNPETAS